MNPDEKTYDRLEKRFLFKIWTKKLFWSVGVGRKKSLGYSWDFPKQSSSFRVGATHLYRIYASGKMLLKFHWTTWGECSEMRKDSIKLYRKTYFSSKHMFQEFWIFNINFFLISNVSTSCFFWKYFGFSYHQIFTFSSVPDKS